ncbi:MAG: alpha/beta hydrolase [Rhodospirillales bacterium]|nr:alpha/beta hydrolase [Rhodospirillales bacterium]
MLDKFTALLILLASFGVAVPLEYARAVEPKETGIVLLHGKGGDQRWVKPLGKALEKAGYIVVSPLFPWGKGRIYDRTYLEGHAQVDWNVRAVKRNGAKHVIIAGHSLGANVALSYGAKRSDLAGLILLAPGHLVNSPMMKALSAPGLALARQMIKAGQKREKRDFLDINQGKKYGVTTSAEIYLSWFDPDGLANMGKSARALGSRLPVLWVSSVEDRVANVTAKNLAFGAFVENSYTKDVTVKGSHLETPERAIGAVLNWLKELGQ